MRSIIRRIYAVALRKWSALCGIVHRIRGPKGTDTVTKSIIGNNNEIEYRDALLTNVAFDIAGNGNRITIKKNSSLNGVTFFVRGDYHSIDIGEECSLGPGFTIWFEDERGQLIIGDRTIFAGYSHLTVIEPGSKIKIGNDCLFAYNVDIRTGDSHSIIDTKSGKKVNFAKNISIGEHVWVAGHSIILKGVSILDDSIVAAGTVVTKSVDEKGVILAGNPARIVKRGITWSGERNYQPDDKSGLST
jgi:acetyltransferase-like isoleucine patch superfamily enzyme